MPIPRTERTTNQIELDAIIADKVREAADRDDGEYTPAARAFLASASEIHGSPYVGQVSGGYLTIAIMGDNSVTVRK